MVSYESIVSGEKTPVIFDIGKAYIKCGFAGEDSPRFILPSPFTNINIKEVNLYEPLKELVHTLCYRRLIVNPKDRRIVVVESAMVPSKFKQTLADVLFTHFEVPSVLFAPGHLTSLFTLGICTALVVDVGYSEAMVLPVYEGYTLLWSWQSAQLGSQRIHAELERQLRKFAYFLDDTSEKKQVLPENAQLPESFLEDVKVRACFVSPSDRAAVWQKWSSVTQDGDQSVENVPTPHFAEETFTCSLPGSSDAGQTLGTGRRLHIPSRLRETAAELLFTPQDADNISIQSLVLESLLMCPIDCRRKLMENIVCIGGTTMMAGFKERLNEELKKALELPRYAALAALKDGIKFHNPPSKANYTSWLGGAIFGALESLPSRSLLRNAYFETRMVPDWSTQMEAILADTNDSNAKHSR